ncbi:hypothetical protein OQ279_04985 [Salinimicrobium sp. MT39]|uniref:Uncharacterized protein n=1 Tax=Salinimicrobium profundisediminis TaxID=2994553 RepID=A0A9X3I004_9FLAO|nr:hypothetical protein [Salinimicrobium profundisediminis]MCX2837500.1 hypothetical protein [Salinimicrobium profundisediminis]
MNYKSLFRSRNYQHFFHRIKPFPATVKKEPLDYSKFKDLSDLLDYMEIKEYRKIVVVASGPSASKIIFDKENIYFACNDSLRLVQDLPHIYMLYDMFYLTRYLKTYEGGNGWKGSIFWYNYNNPHSHKIYRLTRKYLQRYSREKREFLITNKSEEELQSLYYQAEILLQEAFDYRHYRVNSGFNTLVFAALLAYLESKPLEVYGLDMGIGGNKYFNKDSPLGRSVKSQKNRELVKLFLDKLYRSDVEVKNFSNFQGNVKD